MRKILFALLLALAALGARASTFSTDASDLWWNEQESGWGVNLVQQNEVVFATLYVYGPDSRPVWYVGSLAYTSTDSAGALNFTGIWYRTTGPWFGGAFSANENFDVGTATFRLKTVTTGTFSYSVDGVYVSKNVERQTWRTNSVAGNYLGATIGTYSACSNPAGNGFSEEYAAYAVTQSGTNGENVTIVESGDGYTCTYTGTYEQHGRMGEVKNGLLSCTGGVSGTFTAHEVEANLAGITAHVTARTNICTFSGHFGGLSRTP